MSRTKLITPLPKEKLPVWVSKVEIGSIVRLSDVDFQEACIEEAFLLRIKWESGNQNPTFLQFGGNIIRRLAPQVLVLNHNHKLSIGNSTTMNPVRAKIVEVGTVVRLHDPAKEMKNSDETYYWLEKHPISNASCPFILIRTDGNEVVEIDDVTLVEPFDSILSIQPITT